MTRRRCASCGHDPACGFASVWTEATGHLWLCHDDDHSCYAPVPYSEPEETP